MPSRSDARSQSCETDAELTVAPLASNVFLPPAVSFEALGYCGSNGTQGRAQMWFDYDLQRMDLHQRLDAGMQ
jgi:hypothetical protein